MIKEIQTKKPEAEIQTKRTEEIGYHFIQTKETETVVIFIAHGGSLISIGTAINMLTSAIMLTHVTLPGSIVKI